MPAKPVFHRRQMPSYPIRFLLGFLVLLLTLLLIVTAVDPVADHLFADERCEMAASASEKFSAETVVPDCWLIQ